MAQLREKVAVITGASRGMGRHFVAAMVEEGMKIACLARTSPELDSLQVEFGDAVAAFACDITRPAEVTAAIDGAVAQFGRLDILVNNAAIYHPFLFEQGTDEIIRRHIDVNILGLSWATRAAIPHLRESRGQIVNISSESVRMPFPMLALYAASKAAVEVLSEGLRAELRADGIRVSVLRSGSVAGGSGGDDWTEATKQAFYTKIVATGHAAMSGLPATPQSMAKTLISALGLPSDISVSLLEVGAAEPGLPDGARQAGGATK
ncbi:NADP-dependent 3-hydroxy acid dehydrogenase YdfG [Erythromicrobium ramosum]|uniref:NADP-dependent 3-hydroxy acid dehydrogenase YdfG n=1 Tax=Erythrobacter ramosus TaxID=35811 RepID=A0ABR6I1Z4_9SPHN|nr:SDR family oxidoreductase [Erythrobacter ramosus]MBB3776931.1 NADP-dependent 3-hydroxy acid dehydrogenase YdfG [Erythrobacter ramosus]